VQKYHARILGALKRQGLVSVRGCYDLDVRLARKVASACGAQRFGTPDIADDLHGVDAVLIATPPVTHGAIALRYLEQGRAVFVEKPFVTAADEARTLTDIARRRNLPLLVGHFRRLYPSARRARAFIARGGLGAVRRVSGSEGFRWDWPSNSDYFTRDATGGVLYDTGSHVLDMALYVLSSDTEGNAAFRILDVDKKPATEPSHEARVLVEIAHAAYGPIEVALRVSRTETLAGAVKIHGERGTLVVPANFVAEPVLILGGMPFAMTTPLTEETPGDVYGCLLGEHLEMLRRWREERPSVLESSRFVLLTAILETAARQ
jgi:predicted dehydrogenase